MPAPEDGAVLFGLLLPNGTVVTQTVDWKAQATFSASDTADYMRLYWNDAKKKDMEEEKPQRKRQSQQPLLNSTVDGIGFYMLGGDTVVWYQVSEREKKKERPFLFVIFFFRVLE